MEISHKAVPINNKDKQKRYFFHFQTELPTTEKLYSPQGLQLIQAHRNISLFLLNFIILEQKKNPWKVRMSICSYSKPQVCLFLFWLLEVQGAHVYVGEWGGVEV